MSCKIRPTAYSTAMAYPCSTLGDDTYARLKCEQQRDFVPIHDNRRAFHTLRWTTPHLFSFSWHARSRPLARRCHTHEKGRQMPSPSQKCLGVLSVTICACRALTQCPRHNTRVLCVDSPKMGTELSAGELPRSMSAHSHASAEREFGEC